MLTLETVVDVVALVVEGAAVAVDTWIQQILQERVHPLQRKVCRGEFI